MLKNHKIKFFAFISIISLFFLFGSLIYSQEGEEIALVKSQESLRFFGKIGEWEYQGALNTLGALQVNYKEISAQDLEKEIPRFKLIILPNIRCLSKTASKNIEEFLTQGGKLFALYQSSYRDENNQLAGEINNFQLAKIFGADFYRWNNLSPKCEYLTFIKENFKEKYPLLQLGRNTAMMIKAHKNSEVLAYFLNKDGKNYSELKDYSGAIILNSNKNCIYSAENLFAPENSSSPQVRGLIGELLNLLVPNLVNLASETLKLKKITYSSPFNPQLEILPQGKEIKIGIGKTLNSISISADSDYQIEAENKIILNKPSGELIKVNYLAPNLEIYSENNELLAVIASELKIKAKERKINLISLNFNETFKIKTYRGDLKLLLNKEGFQVINQLALEEYLAGVLPNEMPKLYPPEALKAMAIVNRTFALANLNKHQNSGYDLCDTVDCQVYEGLMSESEATTKAVLETEGVAAFFGDKFAYTTFHSCCGGTTEAITKVWNKKQEIPYLISVNDGADNLKINFINEEDFKNFILNPPLSYCQKAGRFRWRESYTKEELEKIFKISLPVYLKDKYSDFGDLQDLKILKRSPNGRVQILEITGSQAAYQIEKDAIRWLFNGGKIGLGGLQSSLFFIERKEDFFTFYGGGWGHGVGLCQEGARGMAEGGFNCEEIIKHYYPKVEIKKIF